MPFVLTLYGADDCEDTAQTRSALQERQIRFVDHSIDDDPVAEQFVTFINHGFRSTPTLVFAVGKFKLIVTEPSSAELDQALQIVAGLQPAASSRGGDNDDGNHSRL